MPRYGKALAHRRKARGFRTARDLAAKSREVAERLDNATYAPFSQQTLSRLETDSDGQYIANTRPRIQRMLSCVLGWSAAEFQAHVGVGIVAVDHVLNLEGELEPVPPTQQTYDYWYGSSSPITEENLRQQASFYLSETDRAPLISLEIIESDAETTQALATLQDGSLLKITGQYAPVDYNDDFMAQEMRDAQIPEALKQAANLYKGIDPLIAEPTIQTKLARAGHLGESGPQTPQDWIRFFNDLRGWLGAT